MKKSLTISALLLALTVSAQEGGKTSTHAIFFQANLIHESLLISPDPSRYTSCEITVLDSAFLKRNDSLSVNAKESISVKFNSSGKPEKLSYVFKNNFGEVGSVATYSYTDTTTFICDKTSSGSKTYYLFRLSTGKNYFSNSKWNCADNQDTNSFAPSTRNSWLLNSLGFDSILTLEYSGNVISTTTITSVKKNADSYECVFTKQINPSGKMPVAQKTELENRVYTFDKAHKLIHYARLENGKEVLSHTYVYSPRGELISNKFVYSAGYGNPDISELIVQRDSSGLIKSIRFTSNSGRIWYIFRWK